MIKNYYSKDNILNNKIIKRITFFYLYRFINHNLMDF